LGIGIARVTGDGPLQGRDGIRYAAHLKAGDAEIVLDDGIGRLQQRCVAQLRDRIGWSSALSDLMASSSREATCCGSDVFGDWGMART
jgi:hypothetical protein